MAKPGGVLRRAGHTEAGVDLARMAGFEAAAVIVEIMNADGTNVRKLTNVPGYDGGPFFSPDGQWIGFFAAEGPDGADAEPPPSGSPAPKLLLKAPQPRRTNR